MGRIVLKSMEFFAFHGVYAEERKNGNRFEVNLSVDYPFEDKVKSDQLEDTIDYGALYLIVKEIMDSPANLLEYLSLTIAERIRSQFPQIEKVSVTVSKYNPPIDGPCEKAEVTVSLP